MTNSFTFEGDQVLPPTVFIMSIKKWVLCNILDRHSWGWCGYQNLYGVTQWHCNWCGRVKERDDRETAKEKRDTFRKELYINLFKRTAKPQEAR